MVSLIALLIFLSIFYNTLTINLLMVVKLIDFTTFGFTNILEFKPSENTLLFNQIIYFTFCF